MSRFRNNALTEAEKEIIRRSTDPSDNVGVNWFLGYFFDGFQFRDWQWHFHHAHQKNITVMAGVGSGKTTCAALSYFAYAASMPYFKFMNLAPTGWQSNLMFEKLLQEADHKPAEKLIKSVQKRPYPSITLESPLIGTSELLFRSAHDDAYAIQGWEGDGMNIDEAGQIMEGDSLISMIATRMRGNVAGRQRMKRLSAISTSYYESPEWLWQRMDMGIYKPDKYLSLTTTSAENLSAEDIELYKERVPEDQWASLLGGEKPDGSGVHFSQFVLKKCEDGELNKFMQYHTVELEQPTPGWDYIEVPGSGCVKWEVPYEDGRTYLMVGDPGQGNPPHRNAGVVMVFDITDFPNRPATLVYFDWVFGRGTYDNFILSYKYAHTKYKCAISLIDSTSTQKLWPEQLLMREGIDAQGMNFSSDKTGMMVAAQNQAQRGLFKWPYIQGIRGQLIAYKIEEDKRAAQDIVCCIIMVAYRLREYLWTDYHTSVAPKEAVPFQVNRIFTVGRNPIQEKQSKVGRILTFK